MTFFLLKDGAVNSAHVLYVRRIQKNSRSYLQATLINGEVHEILCESVFDLMSELSPIVPALPDWNVVYFNDGDLMLERVVAWRIEGMRAVPITAVGDEISDDDMALVRPDGSVFSFSVDCKNVEDWAALRQKQRAKSPIRRTQS